MLRKLWPPHCFSVYLWVLPCMYIKLWANPHNKFWKSEKVHSPSFLSLVDTINDHNGKSFQRNKSYKKPSTVWISLSYLWTGISGGDWSARNKLKAYEGVWSLAIRDFSRAAHLFVDVVPTFESYELADFGTIIRYTVLSCMIALPRCDLKKKLMHHGVMAQALHSQFQVLYISL